MSCDVFANDNEIACKAGGGKVIAAFPDVCLSPPSPPAGPIPVPYPNTSFSKDMKNGSKTVKIKNKEVMLKDKSYYKTSPLGDEAATRGLGAGVITHVITGKTYFVAWSMDVKIEGFNVDRHTDLTTSNHASMIGNVLTAMINAATAWFRRVRGKCECCGTEPHSQAQRDGKSMTSNEWHEPNYDPPAPKPNREQKKAIEAMKDIRARAKADGCGYIFHDNDKDPCAKHYPISKKEKKEIDEAYEDEMMSEMTREQNPEFFTKKYGKRMGKRIIKRGEKYQAALRAGASSTAHRTPRAGGGCPIGEGNLKPVEPRCKQYEDAAGQNQGHIGAYHRKVHNL